MDRPTNFEMVGARAYFRPSGCVSLETAVEMVTGAITFANAQAAHELLINVRGLTGFDSPSLAERFAMVQKWVAAARGQVRIAMVARAELIDPQKFGVTVARNRGLDADIFVSEAEAVAWFDGK